MIEMTPEARTRLEQYLNRMRGALRGSKSVATAEMEQNVQEHVEIALEGTPAPVGVERLSAVLEQLGPPERWLTEDDRPAWRRILHQISTGPEDWRLAYLAFGAFAVGLLLFPIGIGMVFLLVAFFLSRAEVDLVSSRGEELGARRWLVLPSIWLVLVAFAAFLLIAPVIALVSMGLSDGNIHYLRGIPDTRPETAERMRVEVGYAAAAAGAWWLFISPFLALGMRTIRGFFLPATQRLGRRHAGVLAIIGVVIGTLGVVLLYAV